MAFVVVRQGAAPAGLQRQSRLGAVERLDLDLTLLIDRGHRGVRWRIEIEADNVGQLVGEVWVARPLERAAAMRLKLVRGPDVGRCWSP